MKSKFVEYVENPKKVQLKKKIKQFKGRKKYLGEGRKGCKSFTHQ